jgi:ABC-type uncharacterized transport system permease subunit
MPDQKEDVHMRGTTIALVIGLGASALGGMLTAAASISTEGSPNQPVASGLGIFLLAVGLPMFFIAVLVELFSTGTSVRSIAKSSDAALSLLKSQSVQPANPDAPADGEPAKGRAA